MSEKQQLDRTFSSWPLKSQLPSESLAWVRMESVSLLEYHSVSYSTYRCQQLLTYIYRSTDQCQAWEMMCWRCVSVVWSWCITVYVCRRVLDAARKSTRRVISCGWGLTAGAPRSHRSFSRREWQKEPLPSCPNVPRWRVRTCENT